MIHWSVHESEVAPVIAETAGIDAGTIQIQTVEGNNQVIFKTSELTEEQSAKIDDLLKSQFKATESGQPEYQFYHQW